LLHSRDLVWDGVLNVRDLGGHPTEDGRETQFGRIVRADNIRRLSDEGWKALVAYGVRTIVDLRTEDELAADAPAELPVEVVHAPFMVDAPEVFAAAEAASSRATDVADATREVYLIFLEGFRPNVADVIRTIAEAPEGAVLVHCAGGKDRTGLLTAFLLHLAGVGVDEIAEDYALSEERLRSRHEHWLAEAESEEERERLQRVIQTPVDSMKGVFEELERRYGSVEGYLHHGGLTDDELARARSRLRD
jgi:protein-tyrosine phosphatase